MIETLCPIPSKSQSHLPAAALSNSELLTSLQALVKDERRITREILERINEVSRRCLHLELGFPSVFEWLTGALGYSHSAAYRRLEAARLLQSVPEVSQKVESGDVNLSSLARLQTALRQEEKRTSQKVPTERKAELVRRIEKISSREAEKVLFHELPLGTLHRESLRRIDEEQSRLSLPIDEPLLTKLQRIRELRSHAQPHAGWAEIIDHLATEYLKRRDPMATQDSKRKNPNGPLKGKTIQSKGHGLTGKGRLQDSTESKAPMRVAPVHDVYVSRSAADAEVAAARAPASQRTLRRPIPTATKRHIFRRDRGCCSWISPQTGRRCESRYRLEVDHIQPLAFGGTNASENLRLLCRAHHSEVTLRAFGAKRRLRPRS